MKLVPKLLQYIPCNPTQILILTVHFGDDPGDPHLAVVAAHIASHNNHLHLNLQQNHVYNQLCLYLFIYLFFLFGSNISSFVFYSISLAIKNRWQIRLLANKQFLKSFRSNIMMIKICICLKHNSDENQATGKVKKIQSVKLPLLNK